MYHFWKSNSGKKDVRIILAWFIKYNSISMSQSSFQIPQYPFGLTTLISLSPGSCIKYLIYKIEIYTCEIATFKSSNKIIQFVI